MPVPSRQALDEIHRSLRGSVEDLLQPGPKAAPLPKLFAQAIDDGLVSSSVVRIKGKLSSLVSEEVVVVMKVHRMVNGKKVARPAGYELAWHGTKEQHVRSILRHGLKASGEKLSDGSEIAPPSNHYSLGMAHQGIHNWAAAIFVSPSVSYASHVCYAERTLYDGEMWAVVMDCAVRTGAFTKHNQTVGGYNTLPGEPDTAEYRVEVADECDEQIWRAQKNNDVIVLGCTLIHVGFLEGCEMSYEQLRGKISNGA